MTNQSFLLLILVLVLLLEGTAAKEASAYSYNPNAWNGPSHWGSLDLGDNVVNECNGTTKQSPIGWKSIPTPSCDSYGNLQLPSSTSACSDDHAYFRVTEHNLQADWAGDDADDDNIDDDGNDRDSACVVQIPGTPSTVPGWQLLQFHLHTAPEHVLYGPPPASAELHLVHTGINTQGSMLAVIAVRLRALSNADNHPIVESWISHWQQQQQQALASSGCQQQQEETNSNTNINNKYNTVYDILPNNTAYYQYYGSLTTPPCSESVHWSVAEDMVVISHTQWQRLQSLLVNYRDTTNCQLATVTNTDTTMATTTNDSTSASTNNRPLQDRKGRAILKLCPTQMYSMSNPQSSASRIYKRVSSGLIILLCLGAILAAMLLYQKHSRRRLPATPLNRQREKDHSDSPLDSESAREGTELVHRFQQPRQPTSTLC